MALVVSLLVSFPTLLVELTYALGGVGRRTRLAARCLLAVQVVATVALSPLPAEGEPRSRPVLAYVVLVLAAWAVQSLTASIGLWRLGRGQSSVVRHRMRAFSTGAMLLAVTLVVSGSAGTAAPARVTVTLLGLAAIVVSALAFLTPPALRLLWRQGDLADLAAAERGLLTARTPEQVAEAVLPVLPRVFGATGAALLDSTGQVRWSEGDRPRP